MGATRILLAAAAAQALGCTPPLQQSGNPTHAAPRRDATEARAHGDTAQPAERCRAPEHRQFDFWVGSWEVRNPGGTVIGHNRIERESRGCALVERWRGARGGEGISINTYDAELGRWTQRWVGDGATLWLEGGLEGESMVLRGRTPRRTPEGEVLDRITWTPLADGRVRQFWEISPDGGRTWRLSFEGRYTAAEP